MQTEPHKLKRKIIQGVALMTFLLCWASPAAETNRVVQSNLTSASTNGFARQISSNRMERAGATRPSSLPPLGPQRPPGRPDPRIGRPVDERQYRPYGPQRGSYIPPEVLKKYDLDKSGHLEPQEWYQYQKDQETAVAEMRRLRAGTNSAAMTTTTNSTPVAK
jgi:hypothetical protein